MECKITLFMDSSLMFRKFYEAIPINIGTADYIFCLAKEAIQKDAVPIRAKKNPFQKKETDSIYTSNSYNSKASVTVTLLFFESILARSTIP